MAAPFYSTYLENSDGSEAISVMIDLGFWSTSLTETSDIAIALVPVGILVYFLLVHAINIATAVHASWARLMLGSRAEPIALGPADSPPPPAPSDDPPPPSRPRRHYRTRRARVPERSTAIQWRPPSKSSPMCRRRRRTVPSPEPAEPAPDAAPSRSGPATDVPAVEVPTTEEPGAAPSRVLEPAARADQPPVRLEPAASPPDEPLANQLVPELDAPLLVATDEPLDALTPREREVLTLIARGYSNAAIAETFVISEGTVKTHVKRVLAKLDLRDRTQAAIYAYETNFVGARAESAPAAPEPIAIARTRAR